MENLYFKLMTLPQTENVAGKELELYYKKYKETNNLESLEHAKEDYYLNAGKNPLFGRIHSITVGFINEDQVRISIFKGDEKDILQSFINLCFDTYFKNHQMAGWNFSFLLPFLRIRAKKNKIHQKLHKDCEDLNKKAWTITGLDLFDAWKGLGWFQSSLEEVAELTFEIPTNFIDGKDVYNYYKEGKLEELDNSSVDEMMALINVHRGIKGEDFIENKAVAIKVLGDVKETENPILVKLFQTKQFGKEIKDYLKSLKIAKKDKPTVEKLVLSHYLEIIEVTAKNKAELIQINEQRIEEVKEFFKTLK